MPTYTRAAASTTRSQPGSQDTDGDCPPGPLLSTALTMSSADNIEVKATRLARGGAVTIHYTSDDWPAYIQATVEGDTDTYDVEVNPDGTADCTCPAATLGHRACSHTPGWCLAMKQHRCGAIRALTVWPTAGSVNWRLRNTGGF